MNYKTKFSIFTIIYIILLISTIVLGLKYEPMFLDADNLLNFSNPNIWIILGVISIIMGELIFFAFDLHLAEDWMLPKTATFFANALFVGVIQSAICSPAVRIYLLIILGIIAFYGINYLIIKWVKK